MRVRFTCVVDLADGSYEAEFADDRGALAERHVPKACAVVRAVVDHLESGRAQTVFVEPSDVAPAGSPTRIVGKPDTDALN